MLELLDYRRQINEMYRALRLPANNSANNYRDAAAACDAFRASKDTLFRTHPQSALSPAQLAAFTGLAYFAHSPAYRVIVPLEPLAEPRRYELDLGEDGRCTLRAFGRVAFTLPTGSGALTVYWIESYGGGVFLPFRDTTCGQESYGGGRYLYDTIKGADLGSELSGDQTQLVLDFNFAYNPSCAYHPRWVCPLAPPENSLPFPVAAGEKQFPL